MSSALLRGIARALGSGAIRRLGTGKVSSDAPSRARRSALGAIGVAGAAVGIWNYRRWFAVPEARAAVPTNDSRLKGRRKMFNFISDVVEVSAPSVVCIEIKDNRRIDYYSGQPMTVSNGSGFIVKEDGLILTNAHVVVSTPKSTVIVKLWDGRIFTGTIEDADVLSDLATVRIPAKGLPVTNLGQSADLRPGEWVVALGSPLALSNTVTAGVVSSIERASEELGLQGKDMSYIQTDAAITFGNSGGPLVNLDGEAIGVCSMKVTSGISFAIPIDYAKQFLERRTRSGKSTSTRKYLGITMLSLTADILKTLRLRNPNMSSDVTHGVLVWKVIVGSPAHSAGVYPGDIITHIDGNPVKSANDLYKILEGDSGYLKMSVVRDNRILEVSVTPDGH